MTELTALGWVLLAVASVVIGISKTGIPGAGTVAVALFAAVLPARQSTGTILLLLIVADVFAVVAYRRHANWRALWRLVPAVAVGVVLGVVFLAFADDLWVKRTIGVILLGVIVITLWRRRRVEPAPASIRASRTAAGVYGTIGGFTTIVANAAGPVLSMYFLAAKFPVKEFLGTAAWFFAILNVSKVPFSIGLGLITVPSLLLDLVLVPAVIVGALAGRWIAARVDQLLFERLVIAFTIIGAAYLLLS